MRLIKKIIKFIVLGFLTLFVVVVGAGVYKFAKMPEMPVTHKEIPSLLGKGDVLILKSYHSEELPVQVLFSNEQETKKKTINKLLKPKKQIMIGWLEGWRLEKGDTVTLKSKGFKPASYQHGKPLKKINPALVCGVATAAGLSAVCGLQEN